MSIFFLPGIRLSTILKWRLHGEMVSIHSTSIPGQYIPAKAVSNLSNQLFLPYPSGWLINWYLGKQEEGKLRKLRRRVH